MADSQNGDVEPSPVDAPLKLRGAAALKAHASLAVGLALCVAAFWFEIGRAERGNSLSWAYVFEWPLLGAFAVYMWWKILHPGRVAKKNRTTLEPELAPEFAGMLAAWQEHQRDLSESQSPSSHDTPRPDGTQDSR